VRHVPTAFQKTRQAWRLPLYFAMANSLDPGESSPGQDAGAAAAVAAGLVWVSDRMPGIQRLRRGKGFIYVDAQGRPVRDDATLKRIRRLAVPPAYRAVWICPWPHGHLQATGRDARGRKQYRYHPQWQAERGTTKFDRLAAVGQALARIRSRVAADLADAAQPTRGVVLATLVRLLDTTCVRIGNAEYARSNGSYGLTTLRNAHAGISGSRVQLRFRGKGGIEHELRIDDPRVARVVRRCRELPGQDLFQYVDEDGSLHAVGSADVNAYLCEAAGERITAKEFRTWHASVQALGLLLEGAQVVGEEGGPGGPGTEMSSTQRLQAVVCAVAQRLGNTPTVCRKAYIHPAVLALGQLLADPEQASALRRQPWAARPPRAPAGLERAERQLLGLLEHLARQARRTRAARRIAHRGKGPGPALAHPSP
jgi:DNA topoisomerase I